MLTASDRDFLDAQRVGHLATASVGSRPHVIPLCYAILDSSTLVFAVDDKPKATGRRLRRLRNLAENDRFALVVDRWDEDWTHLAYVLIEGRGRILEGEARREEAIARLRNRYPQYRRMDLSAERHELVELRVERVHRWQLA